MELHSHHEKCHFTGHQVGDVPVDEATRRACEFAVQRAEWALQAGRLLTPGEALALAGAEARKDDTLYSIARDTAWETGCDEAVILCELGQKFPDLS